MRGGRVIKGAGNHAWATLPCLDLFTGIGGITQALEGIAHPLAYCDIAPESQAALHDLIARGKLPWAPVLTDVRDLTREHLAAARQDKKKPLMVAAGFPCVGFSTSGRREGYDNEQSALFLQVLRTVDEFDLPVVFLENVANILRIGMPTVVHELCQRRGFELRWCVVSASDAGAPQIRRRWFCLGVRRGFTFGFDGLRHRPFAWRRREPAPEERMACMEDMEDRRRAFRRVSLLGNSVVPDAVRTAFSYLASAFDVAARPDDRHIALRPLSGFLETRLAQTEVLSRRGFSSPKREWPQAGAALPSADGRRVLLTPAPLAHGSESELLYVREMRAAHTSDIVLVPGAYKPDKPPSELLRGPYLTEDTPLQYWATPRWSLVRGANYLTDRGAKDLVTQVRFEKKTPDDMRGCDVNPTFVEWLMGYEKNWTRGAKKFRDYEGVAPGVRKQRSSSSGSGGGEEKQKST